MDRDYDILEFLRRNPESSREDIAKGIGFAGSAATLKRAIAALIQAGDIVVAGKARAARYGLSPRALLLKPINPDAYFKKEADERQIRETFNFDLIRELLPAVDMFTRAELGYLEELQAVFRRHADEMTVNEYDREMERLGIDLCWKSSQMEGNTYSLLEAERLLREGKTAGGKTKDEAVMLLNHKEALRFILENSDRLRELTVSHIEEIHSLLTGGLRIDRGIRRRRVGITGTDYHPLDNESRIREAMRDACDLINGKRCVFDKALLALALISYIQPFGDGNKRAARLTGNAVLIADGCCPLSFRTVDSTDYKKAMLIFYEQNNISVFKQIFMEQYEFAVNEYF